MLDLNEIQKDIIDLKRMDTSYAAIERLAWLVTVRDELLRDKKGEMNPLELQGDSEFLKAVSGKDAKAVWDIMDDLMDTLKVANPRAYQSIMNRINQIA